MLCKSRVSALFEHFYVCFFKFCVTVKNLLSQKTPINSGKMAFSSKTLMTEVEIKFVTSY